MNFSFAQASVDEAAAIAAIKNGAAGELNTLYGKGHWSYQCTESGVRHAMTGNSKIFIAKHQNVIAGTLRLATKKPWAIDINYFTSVPQPLYLTDMAVLPALQHKGMGRYMLEALKPYAVQWPAQAIRLDAYDHAAGAGEFYSKCGYIECGRVRYTNNPLIYFEMLL